MNINTKITIKQADWQSDQDILKQIRTTVFIEEQQVPVALEWEESDSTAIHFLAFVEDEAVGTARILSSGQIGRMAVLPQYRHHGIGHQLLNACEKKLLDLGRHSSFLHAQTHAISFYEKAGYCSEGDVFMDAGIPHKTMRKMLV